jgi:FtsZ-binding cell division protein ZapB
MTQTRSRTATNMKNILGEISGKLSSLDSKVSTVMDYIQKLQENVEHNDAKRNELVHDRQKEHGKSTTLTAENKYKTYANAIAENRNEIQSQNVIYEKKEGNKDLEENVKPKKTSLLECNP